MGWFRHHAMIVHGWDDGVAKAHAEAVRIFAARGFSTIVSPVLPPQINGYSAFFIAPDGSKEGWEASDNGDACRNDFVAWLQENGKWLDWAEFVVGGDEDEFGARRTAITNPSKERIEP